jgi:hypothetical protein
MENQSELEHNSFEKKDELLLSKEAIRFLGKAANWSYIISIIGFIYVGLVILMAFVNIRVFASLVGSITGSTSGALVAYPIVFYFIVLAVGFIPLFYLFRFSVLAKKAVKGLDSALLTDAFIKMNSHYKFIGIFLLIVIFLQLLIGIPALFMAINMFG